MPNTQELWPYMMQELKPTLDELGISTLEEMGYDTPELALPNPYQVHGDTKHPYLGDNVTNHNEGFK